MGTWGDSCWNLTERLHREFIRYEPKIFRSGMFTASEWNLSTRKIQKNLNDTTKPVKTAIMALSKLNQWLPLALQGLRNSPWIYFGIRHFFSHAASVCHAHEMQSLSKQAPMNEKSKTEAFHMWDDWIARKHKKARRANELSWIILRLLIDINW